MLGIFLNFHPVIINTYADAGLQQLAETSEFYAKTVTSLLICNNFRLVHNFIIQLGETVLQTMFTKFMNHHMEPTMKPINLLQLLLSTL